MGGREDGERRVWRGRGGNGRDDRTPRFQNMDTPMSAHGRNRHAEKRAGMQSANRQKYVE